MTPFEQKESNILKQKAGKRSQIRGDIRFTLFLSFFLRCLWFYASLTILILMRVSGLGSNIFAINSNNPAEYLADFDSSIVYFPPIIARVPETRACVCVCVRASIEQRLFQHLWAKERAYSCHHRARPSNTVVGCIWRHQHGAS